MINGLSMDDHWMLYQFLSLRLTESILLVLVRFVNFCDWTQVDFFTLFIIVYSERSGAIWQLNFLNIRFFWNLSIISFSKELALKRVVKIADHVPDEDEGND